MLIYHATLHGFRIVRRINSHLISDMPFIQVGQLPDQIFYRATTHRRNGKYAARDKYNMFFRHLTTRFSKYLTQEGCITMTQAFSRLLGKR